MWPELTEARDRPTIATLHLFSQIVGKLPTTLLPWRNHSWQVALHVTPRGVRTEPLYGAGSPFELVLDFLAGEVVLTDGAGQATLPLAGTSTARFYAGLVALLAERGHGVRIDAVSNEIDPPVHFAKDEAPRTYDADSARRLIEALLDADRVLRRFRSGFLGKASPVHFFWGSFDLAATRFSGRTAPPHPGGMAGLPDTVTREAYSHQEASAGFWPGSAGAPGEPFFYAYAYPAPDGFADAAVEPEAARFDPTLKEFVLPYAAVRGAADPDAALLAFLQSTYEVAADLGNWDRAALECAIGEPRVPRLV